MNLSIRSRSSGFARISAFLSLLMGKTSPTLQQSDKEEAFALAMEASKIGFFDWDIERDTITFSPQMLHDWGFVESSPSSLQSAIERIHPLDRERVQLAIHRAMALKESYLIEYRVIQKKSQKVVWIRARGKIHHDSNGKATRFVGTSVNITDWKEAEETIRANSNLLNSYFDAMPQMVFIADRSGNITQWNKRWFDYIGGEQGKDWRGGFVHHPDDLQPTIDTWNRAIQSEQPYEMEYRLRRHDGEYRWHLGRAVPMRDMNGKITHWFGTNTDIHEQKLSEQNLKAANAELESEKNKFQTIFSQSPMAISVVRGEDHVFEMTNSAYRQIIGNRDILGKPILEALPEIKDQPFPNWLKNVYRTGEPFSLREAPVHLQRTEGKKELRYVDFIYQRLTEPGKPNAVFVQAIDVTDKVQARDTLKKSEEKFRSLTEMVPGIVWSALPNGSVNYYSKRFYEITGFSPEDGYDVWPRTIHPEDRSRVEAEWTKAVKSASLYEIECRMWHAAADEYQWVLGRATPVRKENGEIVKWLGTITNIHELRLTQELLQEAVISRDDFLSIASHELKTPLTSMKLQAQLMLRLSKKNDGAALTKEKLIQMIQQNERQVDRLTRLVDDMLDVSRIRTGNLTIQKETFDFSKLLMEVLEQMKEQFARASYQFPLVEVESNLVGQWDRLRMEQVVVNLLTNAIRYGQKNPIHLNASIEAGLLILSVRDQGVGISPESQEKIFDRFERGNGSKTASGLGLGLFITKQIITAHGGVISVRSELGQGATFTVEVPVSGS